MTHTTHTAEETKTIAATLAADLRGGEVVLLEGPLGAGKTAFAQGLVAALGGDLARSPTFSVMNVYPVSQGTIQKVAHLDFYRLEDPAEREELGLEEYMGQPDTVVLAEWPPEDLTVPPGTRVYRVSIVLAGAETRHISIDVLG